MCQILGTQNDWEVIAQSHQTPMPISNWELTSNVDGLKRNLAHLLCIYGNLQGLKELVAKQRKQCLNEVDKFNTNCAHFAGSI